VRMHVFEVVLFKRGVFLDTTPDTMYMSVFLAAGPDGEMTSKTIAILVL